MIKRDLIVFSILFIIPAMSFAASFKNEEYGYSIEVDDRYQVTRNDSATFFKSNADKSAVVIRNWPGIDEATAKNYLQQGYQDAYIALVPDGELEELSIADGKGFLIKVKGVIDVEPVKGKVGGFVGDGGQGMIIMFTGPEESWDAMAPSAQQMIESIQFVAMRAGPSLQDWRSMLAGSRLIHRGYVDGRRQRESLNLCRDGEFTHRRSGTAVRESDYGSSVGHSSKSRSGLWRVVDEEGATRLLLQYNDGREESGVLDYIDGQFYVDGRPYKRLRKRSCR